LEWQYFEPLPPLEDWIPASPGTPPAENHHKHSLQATTLQTTTFNTPYRPQSYVPPVAHQWPTTLHTSYRPPRPYTFLNRPPPYTLLAHSLETPPCRRELSVWRLGSPSSPMIPTGTKPHFTVL
jgi:hypothetical protein